MHENIRQIGIWQTFQTSDRLCPQPINAEVITTVTPVQEVSPEPAPQPATPERQQPRKIYGNLGRDPVYNENGTISIHFPVAEHVEGQEKAVWHPSIPHANAPWQYTTSGSRPGRK